MPLTRSDVVDDPNPLFATNLQLWVRTELQNAAGVVLKELASSGPVATAAAIMRCGMSVEDEQKLLLSVARASPFWRDEKIFDLFTCVLSVDGELRWTIKQTQSFIGSLPRIAETDNTEREMHPGVLWLPHELGRLVGTVLRSEMELDVITALIVGIVTEEWPHQWEQPDRPPVAWHTFLGYAGVMLTDALAINKNWVDEDFQWVVNDFAHDVGIWAVHTWGPEVYSKFEHQQLLADIISTLAIKYGRFNHDIRMIQIMLNMICMGWPEHDHSVLAALIQERMRPTSLVSRTRNWVQIQMGSPDASFPGLLAQSQLWSLPGSVRTFAQGRPPRPLMDRILSSIEVDTSASLVQPTLAQSFDQEISSLFSAPIDQHEAYRIKLETGKAAVLQLQQETQTAAIGGVDKSGVQE